MAEIAPGPSGPSNFQDALNAPFHIQQLKTKFLDASIKDATTGDYGLSDPIMMQWEVNGQKDFFRKLKFRYLEQEAKLEFLQSITGDRPKILGRGENDEKESINQEKKISLKSFKAELEHLGKENQVLSEKVSASHAEMIKEVEEAVELDKEIKEMELELARLRSKYPVEDRMTTPQAEQILDTQIEEMQSLEESKKTVSTEVDDVREKLTRAAKEVQRMGRERDREEGRAREAREGVEKGDRGVDETCRWYTSSIEIYKSLNGIKSFKPISDLELQIVFTKNDTTLTLYFDNYTKTLAGATLSDKSIDIEEAVGVAVAQNDPRGLLADVLTRL